MKHSIGTVIRVHGGFCYVEYNNQIYKCLPRGNIKREHGRILVGDKVKLSFTDDKTIVVESIMPRKIELKRPLIANVSLMVIVCSCDEPPPDFLLLDRMLVIADISGIKPLICFNKVDLDIKGASLEWKEIYERAEYKVILTNVNDHLGIGDLKKSLSGKISVFAGQSGVGKSSLLNAINPDFHIEIGSVSKKLGRGKHTTRIVQLMPIDNNTYVADTPGFSSFALEEGDIYMLASYFPEMDKCLGKCKFRNCIHKKEPGCEIKRMVKDGHISKTRYQNYLRLLNELEDKELRRY